MRIKIKSKTRTTNWVAMGTLAAYSMTDAGPAVLRAQQAGASNPAPAERNLPVIQFAIPGGSFGEVLAEFERATGWKVEIPDAGMRTLASRGISGVMPAAQGLRQALSGTGVTFRMSGASTATLTMAAVQESIDVNDRAPLASPRYTEPLRDIPRPSPSFLRK